MKKVIRIISRLNIGGPAIHTVLLSDALNNDGYKDTLICGCVSDREGDMSYLTENKNINRIVIPELGREISFKNDIRAFLKLRSIIRRERPDIVHTHAAKAGALGRLAAFSAGVPVRIHTFHGHIFDGYFSPFKAKVFLLIERFLALFTDTVVTVSESVKHEIVDRLKVTRGSKCVVIPLGFDLDPFLDCEKLRGGFRRELGLKDEVLVGIIGRLVAIKNHRMFLNIAKNIMDSNLSVKMKFLIIGDGELDGSLKEYSRELGLQGHVIFTGWRRDLPRVYSDLDVVALTSLNEGTPVSLIEAMASGKAVIATDVGGVRDLVMSGRSGFLSKADDAEDYSRKLLTLINDKGMRVKFGQQGREFVRHRHSRERLIEDIKNLYSERLKAKKL